MKKNKENYTIIKIPTEEINKLNQIFSTNISDKKQVETALKTELYNLQPQS